MMDSFGRWLIQLTSAALIAALAEGMMPKGPVKQIGRLVCALMLLLVVLRPVIRLGAGGGGRMFAQIRNDADRRHEELAQENGVMLKTLIERESGAYILDKAEALGILCTVQVECAATEEGVWLPDTVYITGTLDSEQRETLTDTIESELGIAPDRQNYVGGE